MLHKYAQGYIVREDDLAASEILLLLPTALMLRLVRVGRIQFRQQKASLRAALVALDQPRRWASRLGQLMRVANWLREKLFEVRVIGQILVVCFSPLRDSRPRVHDDEEVSV